jgi:hypothetical protein
MNITITDAYRKKDSIDLSLLQWHNKSNLVLDTTLCDEVCKWIATGRGVPPTNKTDRHDRTDILLKVVLNTINHQPTIVLNRIMWHEYIYGSNSQL